MLRSPKTAYLNMIASILDVMFASNLDNFASVAADWEAALACKTSVWEAALACKTAVWETMLACKAAVWETMLACKAAVWAAALVDTASEILSPISLIIFLSMIFRSLCKVVSITCA